MKRNAALMMQAVNEKNLLFYTVSKHRNTVYTEGELYEYGIRCVLCDLRGKQVDEKNVSCVSSDFNFVQQLVKILVHYQVYPVHMLEILDDLMNRESLPESDGFNFPRICV